MQQIQKLSRGSLDWSEFMLLSQAAGGKCETRIELSPVHRLQICMHPVASHLQPANRDLVLLH